MIEEKTRVPNPTRVELIDKHGAHHGPFDTLVAAATYARRKWPDQKQDSNRAGTGWDVQVRS